MTIPIYTVLIKIIIHQITMHCVSEFMQEVLVELLAGKIKFASKAV